MKFSLFWNRDIPSTLSLRSYPTGFGVQLLKCYEGRSETERPLRFKKTIDPTKSDRQVFEQLDLGDPWVESKIHLCWAYLYRSKYLCIPDSWYQTMAEFNSELMEKVLGHDET